MNPAIRATDVGISSGSRSRRLVWLSRGLLLAVAAILLMISRKFLFDTRATASQSGIELSSALAATVVRVGLGAFPLASAIVVLLCAVAAERVRAGLWFIVTLFGTVLLVRVIGAVMDGSVAASVRLIIPEVVFIGLSVGALALGASASRHGLTATKAGQ
jgi:hypothetical protein